jgi:hypothetical protein
MGCVAHLRRKPGSRALENGLVNQIRRILPPWIREKGCDRLLISNRIVSRQSIQLSSILMPDVAYESLRLSLAGTLEPRHSTKRHAR